MDPSGIRFGTPAITSRGFKEGECARVAELMLDAIQFRTRPGPSRRYPERDKGVVRKIPDP